MTTKKQTAAQLVEQLRARSKTNGLPCGVGRALKAFNENKQQEYSQAIEEVLGDDSVSHIAITLALKDWGHPVGNDTVSRHRRGLCSCQVKTS